MAADQADYSRHPASSISSRGIPRESRASWDIHWNPGMSAAGSALPTGRFSSMLLFIYYLKLIAMGEGQNRTADPLVNRLLYVYTISAPAWRNSDA